MSTVRAAGWDHDEAWDPPQTAGGGCRDRDEREGETTAPHLCSHHRASTERLSDFHTAQLVVACPWCRDPNKREPLWHNGI